MAQYPNAIATFRPIKNLPGINYDDTDETTVFAEDTTKAYAEIEAVQRELGANPSGNAETVADRLTTIQEETATAAAQASEANDVAYAAISDVNNITTYTTAAKQIGIWINGKALYRKVVSVGELPNNATKMIPNVLAAGDVVVNFYGAYRDPAQNSVYPINWGTPVHNGWVTLIRNTSIEIATTNDRRNFTSCYLVLEYYKN